MKNDAKYKVGDLVRLREVETVPEVLRGTLGLISAIITGENARYHIVYDKSRPLYQLYLNERYNNLYWEEAEIESADSSG
tara:strand:+ start:510 stop:749 length:240 start_codon:yes stop_codon:yes gene_type:complete